MSNPKTFGELVRFTPIYDAMIAKYGLAAAAVHGWISNRFEGEGGPYQEYIPRMARELGCDESTVSQAIDKLIEAGEI